MEPKNPLIHELESFVKLSGNSNIETNYHAYALSKAEPIQVVSLKEVFTDAQIQEIKNFVNPKKKECWRNAALFSVYYPDVVYVEGKMLAAGIIGVDHAFNKVGDKYVDITAELCLDNLNTKEGNYIKIQEYSSQEVLKLCDENECYCAFHHLAFNENMRKYYAKNRLQQDRLSVHQDTLGSK